MLSLQKKDNETIQSVTPIAQDIINEGGFVDEITTLRTLCNIPDIRKRRLIGLAVDEIFFKKNNLLGVARLVFFSEEITKYREKNPTVDIDKAIDLAINKFHIKIQHKDAKLQSTEKHSDTKTVPQDTKSETDSKKTLDEKNRIQVFKSKMLDRLNRFCSDLLAVHGFFSRNIETLTTAIEKAKSIDEIELALRTQLPKSEGPPTQKDDTQQSLLQNDGAFTDFVNDELKYVKLVAKA